MSSRGFRRIQRMLQQRLIVMHAAFQQVLLLAWRVCESTVVVALPSGLGRIASGHEPGTYSWYRSTCECCDLSSPDQEKV